VAFPRHDAPLGTDRGEQYTAGKLVLEEGCLRIEIPARGSSPRMSQLVIWPSSFTYEEDSGTVRILDGLGRTVAQVGDHIRVSRAARAKDPGVVTGRPEHCAQPSTWMGDEVTVFDPENEATELRLSDPDVLLLRQKTVMVAERSFPLAAGVGELVLDGPCLRLKAEYSISTIIWPAGFSPHVQDGVVQARNGAGRVIAQVGDEIAGGGAYYERGPGECPGELFSIYDVKVLPDVDVYFPRQDGTLATGLLYERVRGNARGASPTLALDARTHAEQHDSKLSITRLLMQDTVGELEADLLYDEPGTFGGLWVQHEPEYRVFVAFTKDGEETIARHVRDESLMELIEVRTVEATYRELMKASREAGWTMAEMGFRSRSIINVPENRVEVHTPDRSRLKEALRKNRKTLPALAHIVERKLPVRPEGG